MSKPSKKKPAVRRNRNAAGKFKTPDDYLATLSPDKRAALKKLRRTIKAAAPAADECVSHGIPAFRLNGKLLVFYGAGKNHCAFWNCRCSKKKRLNAQPRVHNATSRRALTRAP